MDDGEASKEASANLLKVVESCTCDECADLCKAIIDAKDCLVKKSIWIFGGDGWAYDIGYGASTMCSP